MKNCRDIKTWTGSQWLPLIVRRVNSNCGLIIAWIMTTFLRNWNWICSCAIYIVRTSNHQPMTVLNVNGVERAWCKIPHVTGLATCAKEVRKEELTAPAKAQRKTIMAWVEDSPLAIMYWYSDLNSYWPWTRVNIATAAVHYQHNRLLRSDEEKIWLGFDSTVSWRFTPETRFFTWLQISTSVGTVVTWKALISTFWWQLSRDYTLPVSGAIIYDQSEFYCSVLSFSI
jgi:hypothetical protein